MGASIEHQLLCRVIHDQDFHTVMKQKVDESCFLSDSQTREVFRFIRDHYHNEVTFGSVPSWQILQSRFYGFPWAPTYDTLATLCAEIKRQKLRADILTLQDEVLLSVNVDPMAALDRIREAAIKLTSENDTQSNDLLMSAAYEKLHTEYDTLANQGGLVGIPWPWQILNDDTQGIQDGQFIVIYGRPKNMKSWLALVIAAFAYKLGMRVLFWSLEMEEIMVIRRIAAILTGVDYGKFKGAKLDPATRDQVFQAIAFMKEEERANQQGAHTPAFLAVRYQLPTRQDPRVPARHRLRRRDVPDEGRPAEHPYHRLEGHRPHLAGPQGHGGTVPDPRLRHHAGEPRREQGPQKVRHGRGRLLRRPVAGLRPLHPGHQADRPSDP